MKYAGDSDTGLMRKNNQDSYILVENDSGDFLAVVCDGVGGANYGEVASQNAIKTLESRFLDAANFEGIDDVEAWLFTSISFVNTQIFSMAQNDPKYQGMGTTLVAFLKTKFGMLIANVGDSRAYGLNDKDELSLLTHDHTYVASLVSNGQISLEEAAVHPQRHVITNAIGIWNKIEIDIFKVESTTKAILLCSDGLHDCVDIQLLEKLITHPKVSVKTKVKKMIQLANDSGGYDNITAILIDLKEEKTND